MARLPPDKEVRARVLAAGAPRPDVATVDGRASDFWVMAWRTMVVTALLASLVAAFFFWPHPLLPVERSPGLPSGDALVERGRNLTIAAKCGACHTLAGHGPFSGGMAFKLPFGTIYAPNISSHVHWGIGAWSDAELVRAMREGVGRHGEDLYPGFHYTSYDRLSTDDIVAIGAYLDATPPSATPSRHTALRFPFSQRPVIRLWKLLGRRTPNPVIDRLAGGGGACCVAQGAPVTLLNGGYTRVAPKIYVI
jgi:cytochrome c553